MTTSDTPHETPGDDQAAQADQPTPADQPLAGDQPTPADQPLAGDQPTRAEPPLAGDQPTRAEPPLAGDHTGQPPVDDADTQRSAPPPPGDTPPPRSPGGPSTPPADDGAAPPRDDEPQPPPGEPPPPPRDDEPQPPPGDPPPPGSGSGFRLSIGGRRLYRRADDRVVAGVASGIGDFFGVDPAIIRLAFVCLAIFGGSGFFLYVLGWLFMPVRGRGESVGEELLRKVGGPRSAGGIALLVIAALVILDSATGFNGSLLLAAVLVGIGVLLFRDEGGGPGRRGRNRDEQPAHSDPPVAPPPDRQSTTTSYGPHATAPGPASDTTTTTIPAEVYDELPPPPPGLYDDWRPTPQEAPPEPPSPPSIMGRLTVAATLIVIGGLALIENLTPLEISFPSYAAIALTIIGAGLIISARWGRARGLIPLGVVALVLMAATSVVPQLPVNGVGQRLFTPQTTDQLGQPYELSIGELVVDLTEMNLQPAQSVDVEARLGVGSLRVTVPEGVGVQVDAATSLGDVDALGRQSSGNDANASFSERGAEGSPTVNLDLRSSIGEIVVRRAPEAN